MKHGIRPILCQLGINLTRIEQVEIDWGYAQREPTCFSDIGRHPLNPASHEAVGASDKKGFHAWGVKRGVI